MSERNQLSNAGRNRSRRRGLLALVILFPWILLAVLEIGLRVGGFGYDTAFFTRVTVNGEERWVGNKQFGRRFFPKALARTPLDFSFPVRKEPGTTRIFVLGESAAQGDPQPAFGFSRMLDRMLRNAFPSNRFEVINVAMTAINSHVVLPIARECAERDGDLWIVYMGNNEAVGPFGVGTAFGSQGAPMAAVRANLLLKRCRIGQLFDEVVQQWRARNGQQHWKGMELMAQHRVASVDPRMTNLYANFARNLDSILDAAGKVPVILCTVAVNQRDCPPFASSHRPDISEADRAAWEKSYALGRASDAEKALPAFSECNRLDEHHAELQFRLADVFATLNRHTDAARHFQKAVDEDALRFRADSVINDILRRAGQRTRLLDVDKNFKQMSAGGAPGNDAFYEHVHFHPTGNYHLARMVADEVAATLGLKRNGDWLAKGDCEAAVGLSDWNRARALRLMIDRMRHPPFNGTMDQTNRIAALERAADALSVKFDAQNYKMQAEKVLQAVAKYPNDWELRHNAGVLLSLAQDFPRAVEQLREAIRLMPYAAEPYFALGGVLAFQDRAAEAAEAYETCLRFDPNSFDALIRLAIVESNQGSYDKAVTHLQRAIRANPETVSARMRLGGIYMQRGEKGRAREQFQEVLRLEPDNKEAAQLLKNAGG